MKRTKKHISWTAKANYEAETMKTWINYDSYHTVSSVLYYLYQYAQKGSTYALVANRVAKKIKRMREAGELIPGIYADSRS